MHPLLLPRQVSLGPAQEQAQRTDSCHRSKREDNWIIPTVRRYPHSKLLSPLCSILLHQYNEGGGLFHFQVLLHQVLVLLDVHIQPPAEHLVSQQAVRGFIVDVRA